MTARPKALRDTDRDQLFIRARLGRVARRAPMRPKCRALRDSTPVFAGKCPADPAIWPGSAAVKRFFAADRARRAPAPAGFLTPSGLGTDVLIANVGEAAPIGQ